MKTIQYFALRIFLTLMVVCAGVMLSIIWKGPDGHFGIWNQIAISSFIVGLASFLVWIVTIVLEIKNKIGIK